MATVAVAAFDINSVTMVITVIEESKITQGGHEDMARRYWPTSKVKPDALAPFDKARLPPENKILNFFQF